MDLIGFQCHDYPFQCISLDFFCDENNDCDNKSDESTEACRMKQGTDNSTLNMSATPYNESTTSPVLATPIFIAGSTVVTFKLCGAISGNLFSNFAAPARCSLDEFKCASGLKCVPKENKCDGNDDCGDGSDEAGATCVRGTKRPEIDGDLNSSTASNWYAITGAGFLVVVSLLAALGARTYCRRRTMLMEHVREFA